MASKCVVFDCFGTVFDMSGVCRDEIAAYVAHVRKDDFTPYEFPKSWGDLPCHPDAREGIRRLQDAGFVCATLSNCDASLQRTISIRNGIKWDYVIDLAYYRVYKPHLDAYKAVEKFTGRKPKECLMVTANPTFGDIEGAAEIGMQSQVIRHGSPETIIDLALMLGE